MDTPISNVTEYSVSEISSAIKRTVEDNFGYVRVRGELGRISRPSSGHIYLDLKDENSVINGIIWKTTAGSLKINPEQGLEVIVTGKITTYPGQSKYQIVIESIEPAGLGALMVQLEKRKKELEAQGLFKPEHKQTLPTLPKVIGVITSPSGAVIRDILHRFEDRFPLHVVVWPVRVQGETCSQEVSEGVHGFNLLTENDPIPKPDILIVARGGGSIEDLWGFNEEIVVRAVADSKIPVISAVGHETDWTLIDYVADVRAPTPTGAAEIAVPVKAELMSDLDDHARRLITAQTRLIQTRRMELRVVDLPQAKDILALPRQRFDAISDKLSFALRANLQSHREAFSEIRNRLSVSNLKQSIQIYHDQLKSKSGRMIQAIANGLRNQRTLYESISKQLSIGGFTRQLTEQSTQIKSLTERFNQAFNNEFKHKKVQLEKSTSLLNTLSYQSVLKRGFALIRDEEDQMVRLANSVSPNQKLNIQFSDGQVAVTTNATQSTKNKSRRNTKAIKEDPKRSDQPNLL